VSVKVYVERNAMRDWLRTLSREGKVVLMLFPYDGHNPSGVRRATAGLITCDSTWLDCSMDIPIGEGDPSEKFEEIRRVVRRDNEKRVEAPTGLIGLRTEGDARHLDSAYKSGCRAFLTTDKGDILNHAPELERLLGLRLFHPDQDRDKFIAFVTA